VYCVAAISLRQYYIDYNTVAVLGYYLDITPDIEGHYFITLRHAISQTLRQPLLMPLAINSHAIFIIAIDYWLS